MLHSIMFSDEDPVLFRPDPDSTPIYLFFGKIACIPSIQRSISEMSK